MYVYIHHIYRYVRDLIVRRLANSNVIYSNQFFRTSTRMDGPFSKDLLQSPETFEDPPSRTYRKPTTTYCAALRNAVGDPQEIDIQTLLCGFARRLLLRLPRLWNRLLLGFVLPGLPSHLEH